MNWVILGCIISFGILFCASIKMWPFLSINKPIIGEFKTFEDYKYGSIIGIHATIANNGLSNIRLIFSVKIKNNIYSPKITQIHENNVFIRNDTTEIDKYYRYYILQQTHEADLRITIALEEKIKDESIEALLVIHILSLTFPFSILPFLRKKTRKFMINKINY